MTAEAPKNGLVEAFQILLPNLLDVNRSDSFEQLRNMVNQSLAIDDQKSREFLTLVSLHPEEKINLIPTLVATKRLLNPEQFNINSASNPEKALSLVLDEASKRDDEGRFKESTYHALSGLIEKPQFAEIRVKLIRMLPYDSRLKLFFHYVNAPMSQLSANDSYRVFKEFSQVDQFKNKKEGKQIIEKAKHHLVKHLAGSSHPKTFALAKELNDPHIYLEISEAAEQSNQKMFGELARETLLQEAFGKSSFLNPKQYLRTQAVIHCLEIGDWLTLENQLSINIDFQGVKTWLKKLPEELTTKLRKGSEEREIMKEIYTVIFSLKNPSPQKLENRLERVTLYAAGMLKPGNFLTPVKEKLYLLYPDSPQAKEIQSRNNFYAALKAGNIHYAQELFTTLSQKDRPAARDALAQTRVNI